MSTFLVLFLGLLSFSAFGQQYKHQLEGSFSTSAAIDTIEPVIVNYNINWNETSSSIQGVYRDNYFSKEGPQTVTGTVSTDGRTFNIIFPLAVNEVKSITLSSVQTGSASGSVPITIVTRNDVGAPIDAPNTFALMTTRDLPTDTRPDNSTCIIGFGALTGFCGLYNGTMREIADTRDRCNLASSGNARFELATDTNFNFYPNYLAGVTDLAVHRIGSFLPSPQNTSINITGRTCEILPATTFIADNCKVMNLSGIFFEQITTVSFTGTYSITDEVNGDTCSYGLNLRKEVPY